MAEAEFRHVVTASFRAGKTSSVARSLWQWDYGIVLRFDGISLPDAYEVHFSNSATGGDAVSQTGTSDGVVVPNIMFESGKPVYAFVYLHDDLDDGETAYTAVIPVHERPKPNYDEVTPKQQSAFEIMYAQMEKAIRAESVRVSAEEDRSQREEDRIATEEARVSAEAIRVQNEAERISGEAERVSAELEREDNEDARLSGETMRVASEGDRLAAELRRVEAEIERRYSEDLRVSDEAERRTAEAQRISAEERRVSDENARQTNETARQAAEEAREALADELRGITVNAVTLEPGSAATADYNAGVITFGIPHGEKGDTGEQGPRGERGLQGVKGDTGPRGVRGDQGARGEKGDTGPAGPEGFSPIAYVTKEGNTSTIVVSDLYGITMTDVVDGVDGPPGPEGAAGPAGQDGVSPVITVTDITAGHRVTVTDASGTHSFDVMDGSEGQRGPAGEDGAAGADGHTPVITASKSGTVTTISVDGAGVATINDGASGTDGDDGVTFTPAVSSVGVISWTNDGGRQNPNPVDLTAGVSGAVSGWLDDHVDPATGYVIDDTLSVAGAAADAAKVGDLKRTFDGMESRLQKLPAMTSTDGTTDLYLSDNFGNVLAKFKDGGLQVKKFKGFDYETYRSDSKVYTGTQLTFTVSRHFAKGDRIVLHMERGEAPWAYGAYITYKAGQTTIKDNWRGDCTWLEYTLTEDAGEISAIYPANSSLVPRSTYITFEVSLLGDVPITPTVVSIKQDGTGDFTTLRGALDFIGTKANDVLNPYRIEIYKGTYNVLADYTDAEIRAAEYTQTGFVGPKLLNGMSLVGIGLPEEVVLTASLDPATYDNTIRGAISTLNCQGSCSMENLTVEAYNIRYCVHDDFHTPLGKKPKRVVKNCVFRGYGVSYTPGTTYGAGTSPTGCDYEFVDCDFGENAGVHTMPTTQFRSFVHLTNCVGGGFRIGDNATTDLSETGYDVYRFDGCGFLWMRNIVEGSVPHAIVKGSNNKSPVYQFTADTLYITDDVVVVPNVNLAFSGDVGTIVEWYSDTAHGPRFRVATTAKNAVGAVVYQDTKNTYIQIRGYVCTNRIGLTSFSIGEYVGLSDGRAAIVADADSAFAKIAFVDSSGLGYMKLEGV